MIRGIGNDIIEIERVRQSIERHGAHFLNRLFTQKEQDYCLQHQDAAVHFAGRFAAKEAIAKALGKGIGAELSWLDLEILNNSHKKPIVSLSPLLEEQFERPQLFLSISHCRNYANAIAIWTDSTY